MTEPKPQNENCLEGIACPQCGSLGPFVITGVANFIVSDDGSSDFTAMDWTPRSSIKCQSCCHFGSVEEFTESDQEPESNKKGEAKP